MKKFIGNWWFVIATVLAALIALLLKPVGIIAVPVLILLFSMVIPRPSKSTSLIFHSVFLFVILTCFVQVLAIVCWMLGLALPYGVIIGLLAVSTLAIYFRRGRIINKLSIINKDDVFSGIVAVLAVIAITIGILHGGAASDQVFRYLSSGFDARQHLSMTMSDYDNQGYVLGFNDETTPKIVYISLGSYPQGWHFVTSLMLHGISDSLTFTHSYKEILALFFATIIFWYGLVTFLVGRAILYIVRALKNVPDSIAYATTLAASILLQTTLLIAVVHHGFANFLPALAYLVVLLMTGVWLHQSGAAQKKSSFLIYGALLVAGTSFSWSLATPIAGLLLVAYWLIGFDSGKSILQWIRRNIPALVVAVGVIGLSAVPFVQALQDPYSTVSHHINDDGGIWGISFVFVSAVFLIATAIFLKTENAKLRLVLLSSLVLPAFIYGAVNIYQYYTTGVATYFSTKVLSFLLMFSVILFGAAVATHIKTVTGAANKALLALLILVMGLVLPPLTGYDMSQLRLLNNESKSLSAASSTVITDLLDKGDVFKSNLFVSKDGFEEDVITTLLVGSMSQTYPPCTQAFVSHRIGSDREASLNDISTCAKENPDTTYYVISSLTNDAELQQKFNDYKNITIIPSA